MRLVNGIEKKDKTYFLPSLEYDVLKYVILPHKVSRFTTDHACNCFGTLRIQSYVHCHY